MKEPDTDSSFDRKPKSADSDSSSIQKTGISARINRHCFMKNFPLNVHLLLKPGKLTAGNGLQLDSGSCSQRNGQLLLVGSIIYAISSYRIRNFVLLSGFSDYIKRPNGRFITFSIFRSELSQPRTESEFISSDYLTYASVSRQTETGSGQCPKSSSDQRSDNTYPY